MASRHCLGRVQKLLPSSCSTAPSVFVAATCSNFQRIGSRQPTAPPFRQSKHRNPARGDHQTLPLHHRHTTLFPPTYPRTFIDMCANQHSQTPSLLAGFWRRTKHPLDAALARSPPTPPTLVHALSPAHAKHPRAFAAQYAAE